MKKHVHKATISFDIDSDYDTPTEKEFLEGMLRMLKHLTSNPNQIFNKGKGEGAGSLTVDEPVEDPGYNSLKARQEHLRKTREFQRDAKEFIAKATLKGHSQREIEQFLEDKRKQLGIEVARDGAVDLPF